MSREEILALLIKEVAVETEMKPEDIRPDGTFHQFGLDSLSAIVVMNNVEFALKIKLNPMNFWDYNTPSRLADFIVEKHFT